MWLAKGKAPDAGGRDQILTRSRQPRSRMPSLQLGGPKGQGHHVARRCHVDIT